MTSLPVWPALAGAVALAVVWATRAQEARPAVDPPREPRVRPRERATHAIGGALTRAGVPIGPRAFVLATAAAVMATGGAAATVAHPLAGAGAAVGVVALASRLLRSAGDRYARRVAAQLPVVAQQLGGALAAGMSLRQAIERSARELPAPAADELARVAADLRLGARTEDALDALVERVPVDAMRIMVGAIAIQRSVGGDLAGALSHLAVRLDERTRLAREVAGATAQARMSAWLVAALPAAGAGIVELVAPGTLGATLSQPAGRIVAGAAALLDIGGLLLVRAVVGGTGLDAR